MSQARASVVERHCPKCTYINQKSSQTCDMCDFDLNNEKLIINPRQNQNNDSKPGHSSKAQQQRRVEVDTNKKADDSDVIEISPKSGKPVSHNHNRVRNNNNNNDYENVWTCIKCTYATNPAHLERCDVCNFKRARRDPSNEPTPASSHRPNLDAVKVVKVVNHARDNPPPGRWVCEICGHRNEANLKSCEMCESNIDNILEHDVSDEFRNKSLVHDDSLLNNTTSLASRSQKATSLQTTFTNATIQADEIWRNIIKYCKEHKLKFVDDSFPPCDKSLFTNRQKKPANLVGVQWLSPEQINTHANEKKLNWSVLNNPQFNDIKQGLLGNCWLLSGLAVILEQPELLNKILITKDYCEHGCYLVRLCHNGEWQTVIVDDVFPCDCNGYLLYSKASRKQLWVPLIEKAMAKLNGSYDSLIAGHTVEGLSALTGYPCHSIRLERLDPNEDDEIDTAMIWAQLLSMKEAGYALGASCGRTSIQDDKFFTNFGLLPRHAYSILDVKEFSGYRLILIRNPWGRHSWTGDWSENSPKWTPELRRAVQTTRRPTSSSRSISQDEGVFWMSFSDFVKYFNSVDVCKTRLDWFESRMSGQFCRADSSEMQAFRLAVFETAEINMGLFHKSNKNRRESGELDMCFAVFKTTGGGGDGGRRGGGSLGKLVKLSKHSIGKFTSDEMILEPAEYIIVPFSLNYWNTSSSSGSEQNDVTLYTMVFHSPKSFFIEQEIHPAHFLGETLIELCVSMGKRTYSGIDNACIYSLTSSYRGMISVAENFNEHKHLQVELDCSSSTNMVSTRSSLVTKDSVPPMHRQCLLVLTQLEVSSGYHITYNVRYRLSSSGYLNSVPNSVGHVGLEASSQVSSVKNFPSIKAALHKPRPILFR